jgi:hypothetical protein
MSIFKKLANFFLGFLKGVLLRNHFRKMKNGRLPGIWFVFLRTFTKNGKIEHLFGEWMGGTFYLSIQPINRNRNDEPP